MRKCGRMEVLRAYDRLYLFQHGELVVHLQAYLFH